MSAVRGKPSTFWTTLVINADALLDVAEFAVRFQKKRGGLRGRVVRFPTPKAFQGPQLLAQSRRAYSSRAITSSSTSAVASSSAR